MPRPPRVRYEYVLVEHRAALDLNLDRGFRGRQGLVDPTRYDTFFLTQGQGFTESSERAP